MKYLFCLFIAVSSPTWALDKPNIVFVLADDMGYGDLKSFNPASKINTPNLDQLASEGMCFTDAHAGGSTCRPSRYSLLTGRFAARKNSLSDKTPTIDQSRPTLASMLRENGYRTAMVGKWHLGFDRLARTDGGSDFDYSQPITGGPMDRGFDSFFGMHASLDIQPYFFIRDRMATMPASNTIEASTSKDGEEGWNKIQGAFWRSGQIASDFNHARVTPRFADEACNVIQSHNGEKPLFLYLALPSPHTPWLPTKEFVGKSKAGMYGDFVMTVDHHVGRVFECLSASKLHSNTLVIFSSDNGPVWYEKDVKKFGHDSAGPLRGIKGSAWEGGHRVPFVVKWSGRVKRGFKNDHTIAFADVFATLAEVVGHKEIQTNEAEDSVSFLQAMLQPNQIGQPRSPIMHGGKVIRDGEWKLINTKGSRGFSSDKETKHGIALYNLKDDLAETKNLASAMPHKVDELRAKIARIMGNSPSISSASGTKWRDLFNGKDLSGWQANMHPDSFSVVNGLLKVHGKNGMSHLFFVDDQGKDVVFKNFELTAVVRSEPNSNSGIFFHTNRELRKKKYLNKGYELQLNSSKKEKRKTGSLYAIVDLPSSPVDETEWFEIRLKVRDKRIEAFINNDQVLDYSEPDDAERPASRAKRLIDPKGGAIALQAHDPNSVFYFKTIRIRELP